MADTGDSITGQASSPQLGVNVGGYSFNLPVPATISEKLGAVTDIFTAGKNNLQNLANIAGGVESVAQGNLQLDIGTPTVSVEKPTIVLSAGELMKKLTPYLVGAVLLVLVLIMYVKRG